MLQPQWVFNFSKLPVSASFSGFEVFAHAVASSKLIKPKEGTVVTSELQLIGQKSRWQTGCEAGI